MRGGPSVVLLLTSGLWLGCGSNSILFQCAEDSQCVEDGVEGFCEATGACSFPDDTCPSGRRYGPLSSGGLADRCVQPTDDTEDGSTTAPMSTSGPAESSTGAPMNDGSSSSEGSSSGPETSSSSGSTGPDCGGLGAPCCMGACDAGLLCEGDACVSCELQVDANEYFTCGRRSDGLFGCWGSDLYGQLGDGPEANPGGATLPVLVELEASTVGLGAFHACGVTADGLACWGRNDRGQVGVGSVFEMQPSPAEVALPPVQEVVAGSWHTMALTTDGQIYCWGWNNNDQCLDGGANEYETPALIPDPLGNTVQITAGAFHSCVRGSDGQVRCWGRNTSGELGIDGVDTAPPGEVPGLPSVTAIAAGDFHTCAIAEETEAVWCWGASNFGQTGETADSDVPFVAHPVAGLPSVQNIALGDDHSCAWSEDALYCWGANGEGQLGVPGPDTPTPQEVDIEGVVQVSMGRRHTCVVNGTPEILCFGENTFGELGNGGNNGGPSPTVAAFGCDTTFD